MDSLEWKGEMGEAGIVILGLCTLLLILWEEEVDKIEDVSLWPFKLTDGHMDKGDEERRAVGPFAWKGDKDMCELDKGETGETGDVILMICTLFLLISLELLLADEAKETFWTDSDRC